MPGMNPLSNKNMKVNTGMVQPAANPVASVTDVPDVAQKPAPLLSKIPAVSQKPIPVPSKGRALGRSGMIPSMPNGRPYPQLPMMEPRPFKVK